MKLGNKIITLAVASVLTLITPAMAFAAPHFTLTPASGNYNVGENFSVVLGVDSDTAKVVGIDMKASYDTSKLEIVSIEKGNVPSDEDLFYQFSYSANQTIIHSDTGIFEVTLTPISSSVLKGPVIKQELLKVTFKPKATGTATLSFVCTAASLTETNIINEAGADVVDCGTNQSGSYTISGSSAANPTSTPTPGNDSGTVTTPTKAASTGTLPKTGGVTDTIALLIVGMSSIGAALYFKYL